MTSILSSKSLMKSQSSNDLRYAHHHLGLIDPCKQLQEKQRVLRGTHQPFQFGNLGCLVVRWSRIVHRQLALRFSLSTINNE